MSAASMASMDASQSALDSLRTVEFRETLKGYHRDDVDEYLEKAAVEAEGLQEQLRQSGERLRQAAERISQLEAALEQQPAPQPAEPAEPAVADDTLQRTLILAQQFVDQTRADAEAQAARTVAEAEASARLMTDKAQAAATQIASESEQRLREEINRLEDSRTKLNHQVETMSRHLEGERNRLRTALSDILRWVDENVQPAQSGPAGQSSSTSPASSDGSSGTGSSSSSSSSSTPATPGAAGTGGTGLPTSAPSPSPSPSSPSPSPQEGNRPAVVQQGAPSQTGTGAGPSGEVTQLGPTGSNSPAEVNAALPL
jgi:DivIVA domain-containing protein